MSPERAVVLVGHGGVPADFPKRELAELKQLEAGRLSQGGGPMGKREAELDGKIRAWPRTPETEPYKFGAERLAQSLRKALPGVEVVLAYNEFCAPSVEAALSLLAGRGVKDVTLLSTMMTPGGYHSEIEIPRIVASESARRPDMKIRYAWPFDMDELARHLAGHLRSAAFH